MGTREQEDRRWGGGYMAGQERKWRQGDIGLSGEQEGAEAGQREKHVTSMKDKGVKESEQGAGT